MHFSPETCFLLRGDSQHLRQVVINLVANAIKFTDHGAVELRITTLSQYEKAAHLKFEVIDSGIGIAREAQQTIFESFTQADANITRKYGGTGLGTTISKQLVHFMGGKIGLQSELGKGSTFWFVLPFAKQAENNVLAAQPTLEKMTVLAMGINADECTAIASHLTGWGVRFSHTESLAGFFSRLTHMISDQQKNLVVLAAPQNVEIDTQEFAKHLWAQFSAKDVSLILTYTELPSHSEEELLAIGYSCSLKLPLDKTLLFSALHGVMAPLPESSVISFREHYERNTLAKRGLHILVADDNGTNRKIISKILERAGHRVEVVENGEEALDKLESAQYDMAILDMYMPAMGGLEVVKIYRATNRHAPYLPVAILTANVTLEARQECEEAGINAFLSKPINAHALLDTVAQLTVAHVKAKSQATLATPTLFPQEILLNENTLRKLESLGGIKFVDNLSRGFITESERTLADMQTALERHEFVAFKEKAHTLKGSAGNIGAEILLKICREIAQLNSAGWHASASILLGKALANFKLTHQALLQYLELAQRVETSQDEQHL
ncbi:MAG: ATP-binding protein [Gallionellaceae bacterium]|nr:ATP-binding protein [Gallionellaceae bacterium]